ncbi:MAG: hypothetical protein DI551_09325 [Micavibrio aeruginosavorus]|uniref:Uncharacterized protein n=1 Tax=Micavibrio aeruginosavorus TaxID=349221 RepID=A0A2W5MWZ0_9BACT|nr:MAG: hypothetical protein DI551_09325 [Micavibrio aeruginosavorus]
MSKKSDPSKSKAGIAEIFAAFSGVVSLGVTLSMKGIETDEHPLTNLACNAASEMYRLQCRMMGEKGTGRAAQDRLAAEGIDFLSRAATVLADYPKAVLTRPFAGSAAGGTAKDVRDHILDMRRREWKAETTRPLTPMKLEGLPKKPFQVAYLPLPAIRAKRPAGLSASDDHKAKRRGRTKPAANIA